MSGLTPSPPGPLSPKRGEGEKTRFDQRSRHPSYCQNARLDQTTANVEGASSKYYWLAAKNELIVVFGNSWQSIVCSGAGKCGLSRFL